MGEIFSLWEIEEVINMNCSSDFEIYVYTTEHQHTWYWSHWGSPSGEGRTQERNLWHKFHEPPTEADTRSEMWEPLTSGDGWEAFGHKLRADMDAGADPNRRFSRWIRRPQDNPDFYDKPDGEFVDPEYSRGWGIAEEALICDIFYPGGAARLNPDAHPNWGHPVYVINRMVPMFSRPIRTIIPPLLLENLGLLLGWTKKDGRCTAKAAGSRKRANLEAWRVCGFRIKPPEGKQIDMRKNPLAPLKFMVPKDLENLLLDNCGFEFEFSISAVTRIHAWYWATGFYQDNEEIISQAWRPPRATDNDWGLLSPGMEWTIAFGHTFSRSMFEWIKGPPPSNVYGYGFVVHAAFGDPASCDIAPGHENWGISERMLGFHTIVPGGIGSPVGGALFSSRSRGIYNFIPEYWELNSDSFEWTPLYMSPGWACTATALGEWQVSKQAYRITGFKARRPPGIWNQNHKPFNNRHNPWANSRQKFGPPPGEEEICPYYQHILEPPPKDSGCGLVERDMKCCKELLEIMRKTAAKTDEIHKSLDAAEVADGGEVPALWGNPLAPADEVLKIQNYRELLLLLFRQVSSRGFQPFSLPLDPDNPDTGPSQDILSLSGALQKILEFLVDVEDDQDTTLNLNIRMAYEIGRLAQMSAVQGTNVANIQDFLISDLQMETTKFPLRINPFCGLNKPENQKLLEDDSFQLSQLLQEFLQDTEVDVVQYKMRESRNFRAYILEILSVLQAVSAASGNIPVQPPKR